MNGDCGVSQCGRPCQDLICALHAGELVDALTQLAGEPWDLLRELEVTATRQAKLGSPVGVRRGGEKPVFFHPAASALLADTRRALLHWGQLAAANWTHLQPQTRDARETAAWLAEWPGLLAGLDGVGQMHDTVTGFVARILRVVDRPGEYALLGLCSAQTEEAGECQQWLYAPRDRDGVVAGWHRCPGCGTVHDVGERRRVMLQAKADVGFTAVEVSRVFAQFGVSVSPTEIYRLKYSGRLVPINRGQRPPLYFLRHVEALLFPDSARRVGEAS